MAEITTQVVTDQHEWEGFLAQHPEANFLQSWYWGEFNEVIKHPAHYVGLYDGANLVGVMLGVVEPAKRGRYLTVPGGPIIDWHNQQLVSATIQAMRVLAKQTNCAFVRVRPQLLQNDDSVKLFKKLGFRPAQMHMHAELTLQLDITKELGELQQNFRKNTRYDLKQAKKRGIVISSTDDPSAIQGFYDLQLVTAQRHGFVPYAYDYLHEQFKIFSQAGKARLYSAHTKDGKLIAQAFVIFYNAEAAYHYGASTELGRKEPGAYAIQWEAIQEAKRRGMSRYNFWGVVGQEETTHRFYGVSVFKRGFRGQDVQYLHAHDLVINKAKYLPNFAIEYIRKRKRHV